ncbi:hypothetical protein [Alienimonas chondri]|uniref:Uncharacterized protein n=1 Tax=Alienimonas chondri TaxID=2681879 RepID=A0ABX1VD05_9PLAN|nr:hypothetical protein [Alienimonas chondri]NNJ25934.1 hypothetical protein [Alienimonas chondri]
MPTARFTTITRPSHASGSSLGSGRRIDFIAFMAAKLNATPAEVAAAQAAAQAMRAKLDGFASVPQAAPRRHDGRLPFPPFDTPTPAAAPADAVTDRRYTRTAA